MRRRDTFRERFSRPDPSGRSSGDAAAGSHLPPPISREEEAKQAAIWSPPAPLQIQSKRGRLSLKKVGHENHD